MSELFKVIFNVIRPEGQQRFMGCGFGSQLD